MHKIIAYKVLVNRYMSEIQICVSSTRTQWRNLSLVNKTNKVTKPLLKCIHKIDCNLYKI